MKEKIIKILKITFVVLSAFFVVAYIGAEILKLPMNSDSACMMLEADDILSGNLFLSGWNLTGVSFLTTDLPWFVIGTAVFGVGLNAFRLTVFMMYIFMVLSAAPLVFYKINDKFKAYCVFLGVGVVPTTYALSHAFVHTAGFAVSFLMIFAAMLYGEKPTKPRMALLVLLCAFGACGDRISLAVALVPLMAVCVFGGTKNPKKMLCGMFGGAVLGIFMEKAYLFVGGANLNSLSRTAFSELRDIPSNIRVFIEYFLKLINANFFGKELFSIKTGVFALKILLVLFAVFAVYLAIRALVAKEETDVALSALGIGFAIMTLLMVLTTMNSDMTSGRYIAYLPLLIAVVLARTIDIITIDSRAISCFVCAGFVLLAASGMMPHGSSYSCENTYSRLASFLERENLTNGYAAFWDSTVLDAYSGGAVHVSPVRNGENGVEPRLWFSKNSWYSGGDFVIVRRENAVSEEENYNYNGIYNVHLAPIEQVGKTTEKPFTIDAVLETLGAPREVKTFEIYDILIYDRLNFNE